MQWWLIGAGLNGIMGVAMGALAAHGLDGGSIGSDPDLVKTGAGYQLWHAAALAGIGAWSLRRPAALLSLAGWLMGLGALAFGCGIYAGAFSLARGLGLMAPIGGLSMIAGWMLVALCGAMGGGKTR